MSEPGRPLLSALVYARRFDGSVLLAQRRRPPFAGRWVAPGGQVEPGESPLDAARREFRVRTGLTPLDLELRGVIRETSPRDDFDWLLFLYRCGAGGCHEFDGQPDDCQWWNRDDLDRAALPEADRWWLPLVLGGTQGLIEATIRYDQSLEMVEIEPARRSA